jgi:LPXTG-motif cell wall-anchored protein
MADNKYVTNTSAQCTKTVTFEKGQPTPTPTPTAPSELPNTGAGSVAGLFAGATMFGAIGYRFLAIRKR